MTDAKRRKLAPEQSLRALTLTKEDRNILQKEYEKQMPFPYLTISEFCNDAFVREAREEIISQLKADYKETDIFKVLQTKDLANLDSTSESLCHLVKLRNEIYSQEFRNFVEEITGCPKLLNQVDCSCNVYPQSGHLLCHDDVIGTRCVSYILYLTDPDEEWLESDGGALELYSAKSGEEVLSEPVKKILPCWNQLIMFKVQPGVSFHSVQEVYTFANYRLSISGWFHSSPQPASENQLSTLKMLKDQTHQSPIVSFSFQNPVSEEGLPQEDVKVLEKWINKIYLDSENIERIYETFKEEGSIQLQDFLTEECIESITTLIPDADKERLQANEEWRVQGPPYKKRYLQYSESESIQESKASRLGQVLHQLEAQLFQTESFARFLHELTGVVCLGGKSEARVFRRGSDYTIALYNDSERDSLDAVLCFVNEENEEAKFQWESGEVGGFEAYLLADTEEASAADIYRANDEDTGVLSVSPVCNTLNLVLSEKGLIKFVKYLNTCAPGHRWDVSVEYQIDDQEVAEEDDDDDQASDS